ncbi:MAG: hypothetical protein ACOYWZ_08040 [Bacillota bacterium]
MKDLTNLRLDWDITRIDSIYQIEMLDAKDIGAYVQEFLLPNLQKSYKHAKQYLTSNSRRSIYSIKKLLADLIEDQKFVKISTAEDLGSEYFTRYEALFLLMESLNLLYFFSAIVKQKTEVNSEYRSVLRTIMKLTGPIQKEVLSTMELD